MLVRGIAAEGRQPAATAGEGLLASFASPSAGYALRQTPMGGLRRPPACGSRLANQDSFPGTVCISKKTTAVTTSGRIRTPNGSGAGCGTAIALERQNGFYE